jgi:hypothetical protein
MKVKEYFCYSHLYPEKFEWGYINSISLSDLSQEIVDNINKEMKKERNFVPGLRMALNLIAEIAEID